MTSGDDEEILALLPVTFARRRTVDAGAFGPPRGSTNAAEAMRLGRRPTFSGVGAYRRWSADAESAGFPVGGMAMLLGLTAKDLIVYTPRFFRARPKRRAGAVPLADIVQMTAMRSIISARLVVLMQDGGIVELETMRVGRARRFVAALLDQRSQLR